MHFVQKTLDRGGASVSKLLVIYIAVYADNSLTSAGSVLGRLVAKLNILSVSSSANHFNLSLLLLEHTFL